MVCVYVADIKDLPDPLEVPKSMEELSENRKEKIRRCMYPKDRKQSLAAGLLLNKVLTETLQKPNQYITCIHFSFL